MPKKIDDIPKLNARLTQEKARWKAAETAISKLAEQDLALRLGFAPEAGSASLLEREQHTSSNKVAPSAGAAPTTTSTGYPAAYDLRNVGGKNFISPIRDQGNCGSCVAFGSIAAVEGTMRVQSGNPNHPMDLSEAQLFYCVARSQGRTCGGATGGWWVDPALTALVSPGISDEACYPYTAGDQNCTGLCSNWETRASKIQSYRTIKDPATMKAWISTKGPLVTCFTVYYDFYTYSSGVYHHVTGDSAGGHCVAIIGYDDPGAYWICKNSWGTGWGEAGFFRIGYGECGIDYTTYAIDRVRPAKI